MTPLTLHSATAHADRDCVVLSVHTPHATVRVALSAAAAAQLAAELAAATRAARGQTP